MARWRQKDLKALGLLGGQVSQSSGAVGCDPAAPLPQQGDGMNKTERAFLAHLERDGWKHIHREGLTFRLARRTRYTPDFITTQGAGMPVIAWEVKGFWRDDARVKIKVAAAMYPWVTFIAVKREGSGWEQEIIKL